MVMFDLGIEELDLTDEVTCVDGNEPKAHAEDDTRDQTCLGENGRYTKGTESNGFNDQADGQLLPAAAPC